MFSRCEDWETVCLASICQEGRTIAYGVVQPGPEVDNGVPLIRVRDLSGNVLSLDGAKRISARIAEKYSRTCLQGGEILLSLVGTVGAVGIVPSSAAGSNVARAVAVLPIVREDVPYVFSVLRSSSASRYYRRRENTTVQATLNLRDVKSMAIPWPPRAERQRIAAVLGALDDKIELNRAMNRTLEEMAQALFKSWFIDFDGHDPDTLVDSELGPIPEGWSTASIHSVATVQYGAPFKSKLFNSDRQGRPLIRIRDLKTHAPDKWTEEVHPRGTLIEPGDLLVGMDGEFRTCLWTGRPAWLNQRVCQFVPKQGYSIPFVRYSLTEPLAFFERAKTGTTVIHLGKGDIDSMVILAPSREMLERFNDIATPLFERVVANDLESRTLASLRDTLLPKLISGELRVPESLDDLLDQHAEATAS